MSRSFEKVNYSIRPAKGAERKMLAEACGRLRIFNRVDLYRYIGFGSTFFSDFSLFHRLHGLTNMISIEREVDLEERFEFNKPYGCVDIQYGEATEILPLLTWDDVPSIVWLDYDSLLSLSIIEDVGILAGKLSPGSMLIITVNAQAHKYGGSRTQRKGKLDQKFRAYSPTEWAEDQFNHRNLPRVLRYIVDGKIREVILNRNATLGANPLNYTQLFNFVYQDGDQMLTTGGLIYLQSQVQQFNYAGFDELPYVMQGDEPFFINPPVLTLKERRHLDSQLPDGSPCVPGVPPEDIAAYKPLYRYYPQFVEAEL